MRYRTDWMDNCVLRRCLAAAALALGATFWAGVTIPATAEEPMLPLHDESGILEPGAKPEKILREGAGAGPAGAPARGLLFSGGDGHIRRLDPQGKLQVFRKDARSNGLLFDRDGSLLVCEPGQRRVTRMDREGQIKVLTEGYHGQP